MTTTVLVADDEPHILELVKVTLEDERIRVVPAADGTTALELAAALLPEVVLLDVNMPGLDGFEVCGRLRDDPRFTTTRIIMLTAAAQEADAARGREAGADHYLTKPFSPIRLLAVVHAVAPECLAWLPR